MLKFLREKAGLLKLPLNRLLVKPFLKRKIKRDFPAAINYMLAMAVIQRLAILAAIVIGYFVCIDIHENPHFYIACVTLFLALHVLIACSVGIFIYAGYCFHLGRIPGLYDIVAHIAARDVEKEIHAKHRLLWRLIKCSGINIQQLSRAAAADLARYDKEIRRLLIIKLAYYAAIIATYLGCYKFIYEKLIDVDFTRFWHPFLWAARYLTDSI